jgi:hypothetical protein
MRFEKGQNPAELPLDSLMGQMMEDWRIDGDYVGRRGRACKIIR